MTPERYKEVGRLYRSALELEPARWAVYLAEACGNDEALRQEVASLLDYETAGERLIDQPALEAVARAMADDQAPLPAPSLIGQSVGHFRILALLGKGGMGEVWLAEDMRLNRKVAMKLLPAEFTADGGRMRRFAQEARTASALNHPNIITIHEIGEAPAENGDTHYIVTEYVEGETLRQRLTGAADNRIKLAAAIDLAAQVAFALAAAHEAGIVHRDIKPENAMVRRDGIVKVLDFGLAKLTERQRDRETERQREDDPGLTLSLRPSLSLSQTEAGAVMGTPRYLSPEQARGEKVDARTDIFSLGVMLYEMVAGRAPFAGATTSEVIAAVLRDTPPPLAEAVPETPPELERIIAQALRKDRAERYQTAKDLLGDLNQLKEQLLMEKLVVPPTGGSSHRRMPPLAREFALGDRRRKLALGLAAVPLLAVAVMLWARPWRSGQPAALPRELKVARLTNGGYILSAVLSPDGGYFAYIEQDGAVARLWLRQTAGGQPVTLVPDLGGAFQGLTFAPDGQSVYFVTVDPDNPLGALYRVPALGGPVTKVLTGIVSPVTFAPDGRHLAFIRFDMKGEVTSLVLADLMGGNERIVLTRSGLERFIGNGPSWSPDGKEIACQLLSGLTQTSDAVWRVVGVEVKSGAQRLLTAQQWDGCGRLVWLRDGSGLVMIGTKQGESGTTARDAVWFIAQPDGAIRRITTDLSRHYYRSLSVTGDGQALLVIPFNRSSQIWSVETRGQGEKTGYDAHTVVQLTTGTGEGRTGIVSLDDGSLVYVARTGEHVDLWQMRNPGSQPQQLTTTPPFLEELSAPPDGSYFVFASNRAGNSHLFRVDRNGAGLRQLTSGESREIESDCSPDGRWIVYTSQASEPSQIAAFKLWKIPAEGGMAVSLTNHEAHSPHFSPDGQWISYVYLEPTGHWKAAIIRADGGAPVKIFELPSAAESNLGCRWTSDGQALTYIVKGKTFDNLWRQPLNGRAPQALTDFNSGEIYNYAFARNGQRLFLARGYSIRDVLLIREFR